MQWWKASKIKFCFALSNCDDSGKPHAIVKSKREGMENFAYVWRSGVIPIKSMK